MKKQFSFYLLIALAALFAGVQSFQYTLGQDATPAAGGGVSRVVLVGANPPEFTGETLELIKVQVLPGAELPPHSHPGIQIASIAAGELTYTVLVGEVQIQRAGADGSPAAAEVMTAGHTTVLKPGDALIETGGMIHHAENLGTETVVLYASAFRDSNEPPSILAEATPAS